jgi:PHP family Zn ribbon phosphoesterase
MESKDTDRKLKLDLHTHCFEATGYRAADTNIVARIIEKVKARGLDGIGVTEHYDKTYGFQVKEIVEREFNGEVLIIPGQEISVWPVQVVELYLPGDVTFRFLAHPGYPGEMTQYINNLHGIELDNPLHNWHINKQWVKEIAEKHEILMLSNSDAHSLDDIGQVHNEVSLEELYARARANP